ncbi:MAG: DNA alkylation repair protein [Candidatus Micrarchaeota archaeon]|nr:DNA alkylation repair protein [Candidatus Micrarchaeota archaeon]
MKAADLIMHLKKKANPKNVEGMKKFGVNVEGALGIPIPHLRKLARNIGPHHDMAGDLWRSKIHEARILAAYIEDPKRVTERQMEEWVSDFDSWDLCDQVCGNLFDRTEFAHKKAMEWTSRKEEYVKRAGFVLMAVMAVHDKHAKREMFMNFFPVMIRECQDDRNYVKKAINWALRQIGKRSLTLNKEAIVVCNQMLKIDSPSAQWIAKNAKWELEGEAVQKKLTA